ncbi:hypothetical protein EBT31_22510 [bacterium]|nr:hypothetical protein [bacterium]
MALVLSDRVRETSTSVGTGAVTVTGAFTGYTTFAAAIGNGNSTYYTITNDSLGEWEVGVGTYNAGSLTRDLVLTSSNNNLIVNFGVGSKDVFCTLPAERAVYNNADGSLVYDPAGSAIVFAIALG